MCAELACVVHIHTHSYYGYHIPTMFVVETVGMFDGRGQAGRNVISPLGHKHQGSGGKVGCVFDGLAMRQYQLIGRM